MATSAGDLGAVKAVVQFDIAADNELLYEVAVKRKSPPNPAVKSKPSSNKTTTPAKPKRTQIGVSRPRGGGESPVRTKVLDKPRQSQLSDQKKQDAKHKINQLRKGSFDFASVGPLKAPSKKVSNKDELTLLAKRGGLQTRKTQRFSGVKLGDRLIRRNTYLWTIDGRGVNIALEKTSVGKNSVIKHTNISARASIGGEAWFKNQNTVVINAASGRFGYKAGATARQWSQAIKAWESLGYRVEAVRLGDQ